MINFKLRAESGEWPRFGDYAVVEQKRHFAPNEMFYHKVVATLHSNSWVDVPVQSPPVATIHEISEEVAIVICCGVRESNTYRVRVADLHKVEVVGRPGEAMNDWQTIETAPRDGTEIILRKGDRVTSGAWTVWSKTDPVFNSRGDYLGQEEYESDAHWCSWDGGFREDDEPTHWQPLPAPPTE